MQLVSVTVKTMSAQEQVSASIIVERKTGDTWKRERAYDVTSGTSEATRDVQLDDNQRVVVEGHAPKIMMYDSEQNAAKLVDADPQVRAKQEAADRMTREANVAREQKTNQVLQGQTVHAASAAPQTNLGNPIPTTTQPQQTLGGGQHNHPQDHPATGHPSPMTARPPVEGKESDSGQGQRGTKETKK